MWGLLNLWVFIFMIFTKFEKILVIFVFKCFVFLTHFLSFFSFWYPFTCMFNFSILTLRLRFYSFFSLFSVWIISTDLFACSFLLHLPSNNKSTKWIFQKCVLFFNFPLASKNNSVAFLSSSLMWFLISIASFVFGHS